MFHPAIAISTREIDQLRVDPSSFIMQPTPCIIKWYTEIKKKILFQWLNVSYLLLEKFLSWISITNNTLSIEKEWNATLIQEESPCRYFTKRCEMGAYFPNLDVCRSTGVGKRFFDLHFWTHEERHFNFLNTKVMWVPRNVFFETESPLLQRLGNPGFNVSRTRSRMSPSYMQNPFILCETVEWIQESLQYHY